MSPPARPSLRAVRAEELSGGKAALRLQSLAYNSLTIGKGPERN